MTYNGTDQNGVILVEDGVCLPEGAKVQIELADGDERDPAATGELTISQKLVALARECEKLPCDLPEDLALNHDHYLHGLPKKSATPLKENR